MKDYQKRPENISRTLNAPTSVSRQVPLSEILQTYKENAFDSIAQPLQRIADPPKFTFALSKERKEALPLQKKAKKEVSPQRVIQLTQVITNKKIRLHIKNQENDEENREDKVMIPKDTPIEIDREDIWLRKGTEKMIKATYNDRTGYVKDRENVYWTISINALKDEITNVCATLGVNPALLQQPLYFISQEGSIEEYIINQLQEIDRQNETYTEALKISTIIQGIARSLAKNLGDFNAENRIARKLIAGNDEIQANDSFDLINALARSNPIVKYLHHEINRQDAALLIKRRSNRAKMNTSDFFDLLKNKAFIEFRSLSDKMYPKEDSGSSFSITRTFGMYNKTFLDTLLTTDKEWTEEAVAKIGKLRETVTVMEEGGLPVKHFLTGDNIPLAVKKARKHDKKIEDYIKDNPQALRTNLQNNPKAKDIPDVLTQMEQLFEKADITIARQADSLLEKDLKGDSIIPGNRPRFIPLEQLKQLPVIDPKNPPKGEEKDSGEDISFHPLEGERGTYYPFFRVYKDHLYQGKPWKKTEKSPVFGALNFDPNASHGLGSFGTTKGYYGDVVFVLDKEKLKDHILYTSYARGRAFSDPKSLLHDLILQQNTTDIYREKFTSSSLLNAVVKATQGKTPHENGEMKDFEVQIFQDIPFTNQYIKEIIFASSVSSEKREEIKAIISQKAENSQAQQPDYKEYKHPQIETLLSYFKNPDKKNMAVLAEALYHYKTPAAHFKNMIQEDKIEEFTKLYDQIMKKSSSKLEEDLPRVHFKLLSENSRHFLEALNNAKTSLETEGIRSLSSSDIQTSLSSLKTEIEKILKDYLFNIGDMPRIKKILPEYRKNIYSHIQTLGTFDEGALKPVLEYLNDSLQINFTTASSDTKPANISGQPLPAPNSLYLNTTTGDGNCFFHAVYEALHSEKSTLKTQRQIRTQIVDALRADNAVAISHFGTQGALQDFIEDILTDGEWVPDFGPSIVADALQITIVIHRTDNSIYYEATPNTDLGRNSQQTIHLQYTGAHYNSFTSAILDS